MDISDSWWIDENYFSLKSIIAGIIVIFSICISLGFIFYFIKKYHIVIFNDTNEIIFV